MIRTAICECGHLEMDHPWDVGTRRCAVAECACMRYKPMRAHRTNPMHAVYGALEGWTCAHCRYLGFAQSDRWYRVCTKTALHGEQRPHWTACGLYEPKTGAKQ